VSHTPHIDARARQTSRIARGWFRMMKNNLPAAPVLAGGVADAEHRQSEARESMNGPKSDGTLAAAGNSISTAETSSPHPLRPHVVDPNSAVETFSK